MQEDIIKSVLSGKDTLALLPTGGGKSICFQVPTLAMEGLCVVVSPLIALMKDQVENLGKAGIRAAALISGMSRYQLDQTLENAVAGHYRFLYVSPERLETDLFRERFKRMSCCLLAVDEAHCISDWGYDFRPSYLRIAQLREINPATPVLALTASATPKVVQDIQEKLRFSSSQVFRKSFDRANLVYTSRQREDKRSLMLEAFKKVGGSGIVYVRNRRECKEISAFLGRNGLSAGYYHAGLSGEEREARQEAWKSNRLRIMVCTNAFGMGIDKPDVRLVLHFGLPESLEAYYQEAGRAGRDGQRSFALAVVDDADKRLLRQHLSEAFPEPAYLKRVYHALGNHLRVPIGSGQGQSFDFSLADFTKAYDFKPAKAFNALKQLEKEGAISLSEAFFSPSTLMIKMSNEALYRFMVANRKYELVIKTCLRLYGGLFQGFVRIREEEIAKRANMQQDLVISYLDALRKMDIWHYQPRKELPSLVYTAARCDQKDLLLDHEAYKKRQQAKQEQVEAIIAYAFNEDSCRSKIMLEYFGEDAPEYCGHCDYCLAKDKKHSASQKRQHIIDSVPVQGILVQALLGKWPADKEWVKQELRQLIDDGVLRLEKNELLVKTGRIG